MAVIIPNDSLFLFTTEVFEAAGAQRAEAEIVAEHLVTASLMGYDSHGVIRIPQYVEDIGKGMIKPGAKLRVAQETEGTAGVDWGWKFSQFGCQKERHRNIEKDRKKRTATGGERRGHPPGRRGAYSTP